LRIVGGTYSGRKLAVSKGFNSRPTTEFAREGLFNILANHFEFSAMRVLDLFTGTGSISFEFASRGCREIDLVDLNRRSVHFISQTVRDLSIQGLHPVCMDVFRFIRICRKKYDLIFADPPYNLKDLQELPGIIMQHNLLLPEGWLVLEHPRSYGFGSLPYCFDERRYGNVRFSFFRIPIPE
jgi:16S rRNA (guanine(966)-N(2))-methyltransferase RsmD